MNIELYERLRAKQIDPFELLLKILEKIRQKRMPILILDEVQTLEGIYMNGEIRKKNLLREFFNFLVRLTKETHVAHVVVMTSGTLFLEKIYNQSKLAETSDFYKIGHLNFEQVKQWLKYEGIEDEDVVNFFQWETLHEDKNIFICGKTYLFNI